MLRRTELLQRGIPEDVQDFTLDFKTRGLSKQDVLQYERIIKAVDRWSQIIHDNEKNSFGLLFSGPSGCGKTAIGYYAIKEFPSFLRVTSTKLVTDFNENYQHIPAVYFSNIALFIDGLGREPSSKHMVKILNAIIAHRHERKLPTILATSFDSSQLATFYGAELVEYLKSKFIPIKFPSVNFTMIAAKESMKDFVDSIKDDF